MFLKNPLSLLLLFSSPLLSESVTTEPVGFNKVTCLANSDTIVGVPLRVQGSITTKLAAAPVVNGTISATLTLNNNALPALTKHYIKFNGGTRDGRWYDITANTASSVTIDLNGDNLDGVLSDASVLIAEYWTLNTLFPPAQATTSWTETPSGSGNWVPNGHAIVASATTSVTTRKSELILPNSTGTGINRLPDQLFYITANTWRKSGVSGDFGNTTLLFPDSFITIRHRASVTRATVFRSLGEVELKNFTIPLFTNASGKRDNYVALFRPVPVKLSDLNLIQSGAFVASATTSLTTRRDELLTFDNLEQRINKIPSAVFYYTGGNWRKQGSSDFQNDTLINTGEGFTIRKYQDNVAPVGETAFWINTANY